MMSGTFGNIQDATSIEFRFLKSQAVHESFTENISLPPPFTVIVEVLYWLSQLIRLPRKISQRCNPASFEPETDWWICSKCHHMIESSRGERVSTRDIADKLLADSQDSRLLHLQILSLFDNNEVCPVCLSPKQSVKVSTAMREVLARNVWIIFTSPALFPCSFLIELYSKYQKSLTKDLILKVSQDPIKMVSKVDWIGKAFSTSAEIKSAITASTHDRYLNLDKAGSVKVTFHEESKFARDEKDYADEKESWKDVEWQLAVLLEQHLSANASQFSQLYDFICRHQSNLQSVEQQLLLSELKRVLLRQAWIAGRLDDDNATLESIQATVTSSNETLQQALDNCNNELVKFAERFTEMSKLLNTILNVGASSVPPLPTSRIQVVGSSIEKANGLYIRNGYFSNRPMWSNSNEFFLWFNDSCWLIGKTSDYFFAVKSDDFLPPRMGWATAISMKLPAANNTVPEPVPNLVFLADLEFINPVDSESAMGEVSQVKEKLISDPDPSVSSHVFVESAGVKDVCGLYAPDGIWEDKSMWKNANGSFIWFEHGFWMIGSTGKVPYVVSSHSNLPPRVGWILAHDLELPEALNSAKQPCPVLNFVIVQSNKFSSEAEEQDAQVSIPSVLVLANCGSSEVNGTFFRISDWEGKPMWENSDVKLQIWYDNSSSQWRIGRTEQYYYVVDSIDPFPPSSGWVHAKELVENQGLVSSSAVEPPPDVTPVFNIEVYGAGSSEIDGTYTTHSQWEGKSMWKMQELYMWFESSFGAWVIGQTNNIFYAATSKQDLPPASGWIRAADFGELSERANTSASETAPSLKIISA
jgi:hypothetical protein